MPTWRAEYFDSAKDEVPSRIEIIEAEYEADALVEARSKMSSNCSRAEVTRFDPPRALFHCFASLKRHCRCNFSSLLLSWVTDTHGR